MTGTRRLVVTLTALCAAASVRVAAADQPLPMWQIDGESNRIYLLGSVHLLREQDYPLPSAIYAAYDDAEALIMELDMDDIDPARMQSLVSEMGALPAGGSLADIMGQELYAEAETLAAEINIPLLLDA